MDGKAGFGFTKDTNQEMKFHLVKLEKWSTALHDNCYTNLDGQNIDAASSKLLSSFIEDELFNKLDLIIVLSFIFLKQLMILFEHFKAILFCFVKRMLSLFRCTLYVEMFVLIPYAGSL